MSRPTLRTEFCERVGIEYPVVLAGMGPVAGTGDPVATAGLVAAVSNAGGLGVLGGVAYSPDELQDTDPQDPLADRQTVRRRPAAWRPHSSSHAPAVPCPRGPAPTIFRRSTSQAVRRVAEELDIELEACTARGRPDGVLAAGGQELGGRADGGDPRGRGSRLRLRSGHTRPLCGGPRGEWRDDPLTWWGTCAPHAQVAHDGAHYVVAQGTEAGGHTGRIGTLALLPR